MRYTNNQKFCYFNSEISLFLYEYENEYEKNYL